MSKKPGLPDNVREKIMLWFDNEVPVHEIRERVEIITNLPQEDVKRYVAGIKSQHTKGHRPRKSPDYKNGHVYFIKGADSGRIKIGFSVDPENRLRAHQTGSGEKLLMIKFIPGTQEKETEIKNRFKKYCIHGEWYEPSEDLLKFIENIE